MEIKNKFGMRVVEVNDKNIAPLIASIGRSSFTDKFSQYNSLNDVNDYTAKYFNDHIISDEIESPDSKFFLGTISGIGAGFLKLRRNNFKYIAEKDSIELQRIYVLSNYHGSGLAHVLMKKAFGYCIENGFKTLWLGTWENNARAVAFYKKFGFIEFGEHIFNIGAASQRDILMRLIISSTSVS